MSVLYLQCGMQNSRCPLGSHIGYRIALKTHRTLENNSSRPERTLKKKKKHSKLTGQLPHPYHYAIKILN
jgi:hypothetical protein